VRSPPVVMQQRAALLTRPCLCETVCLDGLVEYARRHLFDEGDRTGADQPTVDKFRWLVRERLRDRLYPYYLRYVSDVIVPCDLDRRMLGLPEGLSFLYFLIRPVRLVGKYGLLLVKSKKQIIVTGNSPAIRLYTGALETTTNRLDGRFYEGAKCVGRTIADAT